MDACAEASHQLISFYLKIKKAGPKVPPFFFVHVGVKTILRCRSAAGFTLLRLDVGELCHLAPFLGLGQDKFLHLFRCAADRLSAKLPDALDAVS